MKSTKRILVILVCLLTCAPLVVAQERQPAITSRETISRDSREVTIIIQQQQLRFAAPVSAQEIRLEVFNQAGEVIHDSGLVSGPEISWALHDSIGAAVPSGLYAYTLTVKEANSESPTTRRGHLIIERGRDRDPQTDRLWVTNKGAIGAEESLIGAELTVSSGPETGVAGARTGGSSAARSTNNLEIFGTPGRIPMFLGGDLLADSVINQDFNNRIGIGTTTPGAALLTVAGQIETTSGGIKFPNGTVQTTSAAGALFQVSHDATLKGNGTESRPLGLAVPLIFTGAVSGGGPLMNVTNIVAGSPAVFAIGGDGNATTNGGGGLLAIGGAGDLIAGGNLTVGGPGIFGFGGSGSGLGAFLVGGGRGDNVFASGDGLLTIGAVGFGLGSQGGRGIVARSGPGENGGTAGLAGDFQGDVTVTGTLSKSAGSFRIDHPLDPANKYLSHSFVESPDMMNVYNGNVTTDQSGEATVMLPDYFESLNRDFRYQLTVIGQFAQAIVASKVSGNRFTIKTDRPAVEVSWQVTGVRQDAYANKHRIPVEQEKPERERGYYIHPKLFDQPEEKALEWALNPETMRRVRRQLQEADSRMLEKKNDR